MSVNNRSGRVLGMCLAAVVSILGTSARAQSYMSAGNGYYEVVIADISLPFGSQIAGYPAAFTGSSHPLTSRMGRPAEVLGLHRTCVGCGGWNDYGLASIRLYSEHVDISLGENGGYLSQPEAGFSCVAANDTSVPLVESVPGALPGIRATWTLSAGSASIRVKRELRVHGSDVVDSRIESSIHVQNLGADDITIGVRDGSALRFTLAVGPHRPRPGTTSNFAIQLMPPSPATEPLGIDETEWIEPTAQAWSASDSFTPSVDDDAYSTMGVMAPNGLLDPAPTPPSLLQYTTLNALGTGEGGEGGAGDKCFTWHVPGTGRTAFDFYQMVMVSYWGHDEAHAVTIPPGEEARFTQYLVSFEQYPLGVDAGPDVEVDCRPDSSALVSGTVTTIAPTAGEMKTRWSSASSGVTFDDPGAASTLARFPGVGSFELEFTAAVGAFESSDTVTVNVVDVTPPRITSLGTLPSTLWPPDHRLRRVAASIEVEDDCDPAPSVRLVSVTSNEPDEQQQAGGDGNTTADISGADLGTDDRIVWLRAERSGAGAGRIYTLTYEVSDASGNSVVDSTTVDVTHDQGPSRLRPRRRP